MHAPRSIIDPCFTASVSSVRIASAVYLVHFIAMLKEVRVPALQPDRASQLTANVLVVAMI
jgi:hypothetical protein